MKFAMGLFRNKMLASACMDARKTPWMQGKLQPQLNNKMIRFSLCVSYYVDGYSNIIYWQLKYRIERKKFRSLRTMLSIFPLKFLNRECDSYIKKQMTTIHLNSITTLGTLFIDKYKYMYL